MPRRSSLSYRDALRLLAPGSARITETDKVVSAGILGAGALSHGTALALLGPKNALMQLVRDATGNQAGRIRATGGKSYYELLEASHTVLALSAFFDGFRDEVGPGFDRLELTDEEKVGMVPAERRHHTLPQEIDGGYFPLPSSVHGMDDTRRDVEAAYVKLYDATIAFCEGLAAWPSVRRGLDLTSMRSRVVGRAMWHYEDRFDRLAADLPEFGFRMIRQAIEHNLIDNRKLTTEVSARLDALAQLYRNLDELSGPVAADRPDLLRESLDRLTGSLAAVFRQPLLRIKDVDFHLRLPNVDSGFISPDFRAAEYGKHTSPEREHWWEDQPRRGDLVGFLSEYLTDPASLHRPLLLLGQPGAGKTLLTRVIAARLPASRFTAIVVPLRRMSGDTSPTEQIEAAIEQVMDERMRWADLRRATQHTTVVVIFDGFDELVQVTGTAHSQYIDRVAEFQETQWDLGYSVIPIITSRILVMDRASVPQGTVLVRLEDLTDAQVTAWLTAVNAANEDRPGYRRLSARELLSHGELARQPLLLTLLAIYYNEHWADRRPGAAISRSDLFTGLLTAFIRRQVSEKAPTALANHEREAREHQLRRDLAITAFAMFNRNRELVNRAALRLDLDCFGSGPGDGSRFELGDVLGPEQLVTAAFFVVYGPDDVQGEDARRTYEFLHTTIGDFLIAEYVIGALRSLAVLRRHTRSPAGFGYQLDTGQFRALLSHQPLVKREAVVGFARELASRHPEELDGIVETIAGLLAEARQRTNLAGVDGYRPAPYDPVRLLAAYTANLVALAALVSPDGVRHTDLMDEATWVSTVRLWRAGLDEKGQLAMISWLGRDADGRIIAERRREGRGETVNVAAEEARLLGDITTYGQLQAGARTWRGQQPDSFEAGRFHADLVSLATRRWPVPSLHQLILYDERSYRRLWARAVESPEAVSSTSATVLLECLAEDGAQLPREVVCGLTRVALSRLPDSPTAPPELIISCPYLIDEFPELVDSLGTTDDHAVLHALILRHGLHRLPQRYVPRVRRVLTDIEDRLAELPLEDGVVSAEMAEQFAAARVDNRTALWLLMALSEYAELAWPKIPPKTMHALLAHRLPDEFLDEASLCRLLLDYLRAYDRVPAEVSLASALDTLRVLAASDQSDHTGRTGQIPAAGAV
ncbi:NACHT domain-containing protein [Micromonospora aurantiaca]|uniref:NACHT domain-containing protein n=1 Tax=Micromonospora aurantiaca (nom. illeg.) TaxID=47850 RepID=UPI002E184872|nr:AAA family ATPase [Micromonospora aurantiaca]